MYWVGRSVDSLSDQRGGRPAPPAVHFSISLSPVAAAAAAVVVRSCARIRLAVMSEAGGHGHCIRVTAPPIAFLLFFRRKSFGLLL